MVYRVSGPAGWAGSAGGGGEGRVQQPYVHRGSAVVLPFWQPRIIVIGTDLNSLTAINQINQSVQSITLTKQIPNRTRAHVCGLFWFSLFPVPCSSSQTSSRNFFFDCLKKKRIFFCARGICWNWRKKLFGISSGTLNPSPPPPPTPPAAWGELGGERLIPISNLDKIYIYAAPRAFRSYCRPA